MVEGPGAVELEIGTRCGLGNPDRAAGGEARVGVDDELRVCPAVDVEWAVDRHVGEGVVVPGIVDACPIGLDRAVLDGGAVQFVSGGGWIVGTNVDRGALQVEDAVDQHRSALVVDVAGDVLDPGQGVVLVEELQRRCGIDGDRAGVREGVRHGVGVHRDVRAVREGDVAGVGQDLNRHLASAGGGSAELHGSAVDQVRNAEWIRSVRVQEQDPIVPKHAVDRQGGARQGDHALVVESIAGGVRVAEGQP